MHRGTRAKDDTVSKNVRLKLTIATYGYTLRCLGVLPCNISIQCSKHEPKAHWRIKKGLRLEGFNPETSLISVNVNICLQPKAQAVLDQRSKRRIKLKMKAHSVPEFSVLLRLPDYTYANKNMSATLK
jgi:hypothetical protein